MVFFAPDPRRPVALPEVAYPTLTINLADYPIDGCGNELAPVLPLEDAAPYLGRLVLAPLVQGYLLDVVPSFDKQPARERLVRVDDVETRRLRLDVADPGPVARRVGGGGGHVIVPVGL